MKSEEKTAHRDAFMFSIMTLPQFDSLLNFINSRYDIRRFSKELGITEVISLELNDRQGESDTYFSNFAKLFLNNQTRLRNIILLNKNSIQ